ncbi:MAG: leucine-rich repeat domain-containing protein, partial [Candidatus Magnetomorum sp.]|nr:leucine-rich repeat domain-containing protein [Candidatus Magnetomorum sp.]
GNLQNLVELDLSDNQLSSLPESFDIFGNLVNLSTLKLENNSFNEFSIDIPKNICENSGTVQCTLTVSSPYIKNVNFVLESNKINLKVPETVLLPEGYTYINLASFILPKK